MTLTSFFEARNLTEGVTPYSVAVYQPRGFFFEKVAWTDIRQGGKWTRPREFLSHDDPAKAYFSAMMDLYESRKDEAINWLSEHEGHVAFCCWCPYDKAAKRQLKEFGSFICHTGPLGEFLKDLGVPVIYDEDRKVMYGT